MKTTRVFLAAILAAAARVAPPPSGVNDRAQPGAAVPQGGQTVIFDMDKTQSPRRGRARGRLGDTVLRAITEAGAGADGKKP